MILSIIVGLFILESMRFLYTESGLECNNIMNRINSERKQTGHMPIVLTDKQINCWLTE